MKNFYRISELSNNKQKFPFATKENCLSNFLRHFPKEETVIWADNVSDEMFQWLQSIGCELRRTSLGNAAGFKVILEEALKLRDDEVIYFVEDDYIHREDSRKILLEGLTRAHYVSLYDHIDKYLLPEQGANPLIEKDGSEITKVFLTRSSHWKLTNSTTYTFATTVGTIREDADIFIGHSQHMLSNDFATFTDLLQRGRSLATPIPSRNTHCEPYWAAPLIDWSKEI